MRQYDSDTIEHDLSLDGGDLVRGEASPLVGYPFADDFLLEPNDEIVAKLQKLLKEE